MLNRRTVLAALAALTFTATAAQAQDWKSKYPELVFAVVPAENASGVTERWQKHVIASPFGTIHAATFSFPRPIGSSRR